MGGLLFFAAFTAYGDGTDRVIVDELAPRLGDGPRRPSRRGSARATWSSVGDLTNPTPDRSVRT